MAKKKTADKASGTMSPEEILKSSAKTIRDKVKAQRKGTNQDPEPASVEEQAAKMVQAERIYYIDSNKQVKNTIKRAYKNYLGIFDEPIDPQTGHRKIFTPLTHDTVDLVSRGVRIEANSVKIKPLTEESRPKAKLLNMILPYMFQLVGMDDILDWIKSRVPWLGTQVTVQDWLYLEREEEGGAAHTEKQLLGVPDDEKKKRPIRKIIEDRPRVRVVNIMDLFLPASAESLEWAVQNASVILRALEPLHAVQSNPMYDGEARAALNGVMYTGTNTDDSSFLLRYSMSGYSLAEMRSQSGGGNERWATPMVAIYTRYGKIPKSWVTKRKEDALKLVDGEITCAADSSGEGTFRTLRIRQSPFGKRGPFEDCRYSVLPNRYFGEGLGERLIPLQVWHNEVINNRRNNEILTIHTGWKYRKGSVDPRQLISRPGMAVGLENMDDLQELRRSDVAASSFSEESYISQLAQRIAGISNMPQVRMSASQSAFIQGANNQTYSEFTAALESYLRRLFQFHLLPLMRRFFDAGRIVPVQMPKDDMAMLDTLNGYAPFESKMIGDERYLMVDDPSIFEGDFAVTCDLETTSSGLQQKINALDNAIIQGMQIQNSGLNFKVAFRKKLEMNGIYDDRLFESPEAPIPSGAVAPPGPGTAGSAMGSDLLGAPNLPVPGGASPAVGMM